MIVDVMLMAVPSRWPQEDCELKRFHDRSLGHVSAIRSLAPSLALVVAVMKATTKRRSQETETRPLEEESCDWWPWNQEWATRQLLRIKNLLFPLFRPSRIIIAGTREDSISWLSTPVDGHFSFTPSTGQPCLVPQDIIKRKEETSPGEAKR